MKKLVCVVTMFIMFVFLAATSIGYAAMDNDEAKSEPTEKRLNLIDGNVLLAKGTVIPIIACDEVSSEKNKLGDIVRFQVSTDVFIKEVMIIPAKSKVEAVITKIKKAGRRDKDGQLEITFKKVDLTPDGSILLQGKIQQLGESPNVLIKYSLLGFLVKGKEAKNPIGAKATATVAENIHLTVDYRK